MRSWSWDVSKSFVGMLYVVCSREPEDFSLLGREISELELEVDWDIELGMEFGMESGMEFGMELEIDLELEFALEVELELELELAGGTFGVSLHCGQFLMTMLTVSLMRTQ